MANGNMNQIMKQAQAMQRKLAAAQEELARTDVEGVAGGGMVRVTVAGGGGEVRSIVIDPAAVDPDDVEMLADMVTAAVNEALRSAKQLEEEKLGGLTAGLGLPPGIV
ncbi:MAG TPA: YbaB/EbfC family nucleoid-associated protein [Egibacteraceae bacterium]|nr:YbaB/EbfC family nucleoid-associated protein [Egibacteraceae bacterium]